MAQVPSTSVEHTGDSSTTIFDFDFPFLTQGEVFASVDGVNTPFVWASGSTATIQFLTPPALGAKIRIYRSTLAYLPKHEFGAGVPFLPRYVDENNRQLLYATQEAINETAVNAADALALAGEAMALAEATDQKVDAAIIESAYQLRVDLAKPSGAGLVGYSEDEPAPTGTVAAELIALQKGEFARYGALGDGSGATLATRYATLALAQVKYPHATSLTQTIDWAACQGYLSAGGSEKDFGDGDFVMGADNLIQTGGNVTITANPGTTFTLNPDKVFGVTGSLVALAGLANNVKAGDRVFNVTGTLPASVVPGSTLILANRVAFSWSLHRDYYRSGEMVTVAKVVGSTVTIYGGLRYGYNAVDMDVFQSTGGAVRLTNIVTRSPAGGVSPGVRVSLCTDVVSRGTGSRDATGRPALELDRCLNSRVLGGTVHGSLTGADDYGVIVSNSTATVISVNAAAGRHCIALGGGAQPGSIPYRDTVVYNSVLSNLSSGIGAADMHGNGDNTKYINCVINKHANWAGKDVGFYGCHIFARDTVEAPDGSCVYGSETVGGLYELVDCTLELTGGDLNAFGAINIFPRAPLSYDLNVRVVGLKVRGALSGDLGKLVRVGVVGGDPKYTSVHVDVHSVELTQATVGAKLLAFLFVRCEDTLAQVVKTRGLSVFVKQAEPGPYLISPHVGVVGIRKTEQAQAGAVVLTSTGTPDMIAGPITYPWRYSEEPLCSITLGGATAGSTVGGRRVLPQAYQVTDSAIRPSLTAADGGNITTGATARLSWRAWVGNQ